MDQAKLDQLTRVADELYAEAGSLSDEAKTIVPVMKKCQEDLRTILRPIAARGSASTIGKTASHALDIAAGLDDHFELLTKKSAGVVTVHASAMNELSHVAHELAAIEESARPITSDEGMQLAAFRRVNQSTQAAWKIASATSIIQLMAALREYHEALAPFTGSGTLIDWDATLKKIQVKGKEAMQDFVTFPGFSGLKKAIADLLTPKAKKKAAAKEAAAQESDEIDRLVEALTIVQQQFAHADAVITAEGKSLLSASDTTDAAATALLTKLRAAPGS